MFLNIILESFENLYEALEKRKNLLSKYSEIIENSDMNEELKIFTYVLTQASLFSDEGITKRQLGTELDISPSTVDKRLSKLRQMEILLEENGKPAKYMIDLNKLL